MTPPTDSSHRAWSRPSLLLGIATVALHLAVNGRYGFSRDELYFIVCGERLAWGYVDQPPLMPLVAALSYHLSGGSLVIFRLVPALAMAATVALTAEFARLLGGGRFAQWLGGLAVMGGMVFLAFGLFVSTDTFQPLTWLACAWCVVRLAQTGDERWWIPFGAVAGFSLLGKYLIAFFLASLAVGMLATPLRRSLRSPWLYAGAALALVIVAPNLLWQAHHGWPFLELGSAGVKGKNLRLSPLAFLGQQILFVGPVAAPVWMSGLWSLARRPALPAYRAFPIAYLVLCGLLLALHGKATYATPVYPILLGAGAVAIERRVRSSAARGIGLAAVVAGSAVLAPMAVPVLGVEAYVAYAATLGLGPSATAGERNALGVLPQHFADMHGWPEMATKVAAVYAALPPSDRSRAVFFGRNYGEAAAIDVFGRALGLPPAISGHNEYFHWGPRGHDGSVVIVIGGNRSDLEAQFREVEVAGWLDHPYAMPYETRQPIYVARGMRVPLRVAWPRVKNFS